MSGSPCLRRIHVSRTLKGPEDVDGFLPDLLDALVRPLTEEESSGGVLKALGDERIPHSLLA
jgi:hypothetical protein